VQQQQSAPQKEAPQPELLQERAAAERPDKRLCCCDVTAFLSSWVESQICNLRAMHWRSMWHTVVFVQHEQTSGEHKQAHLRLAIGKAQSKQTLA
jgi:hypothetical protein